jgi:hypothetical protein
MTQDYTSYTNDQLITTLIVFANAPSTDPSVASLLTTCATRIKELSLPATPVQLSLF